MSTPGHSELHSSTWLPLTTNARGIYLAATLDPANPCYNTAELLECPPQTNLEHLREAIKQLYRENEGFRVQTRLRAGNTEQRVMSCEEFLEGLEILPVSSLPEPEDHVEPEEQNPPQAVKMWAAELTAQPLKTDAGITVRSAAAYYQGKLWVYHSFSHVVADGFAAFNGLSRIAAIYRALESGQDVPPVKRASLLELVEADRAADEAREADLSYWKTEQAHVLSQPDTSLAARSASPAPQALRAVFTVPHELQQRYLEIGKKYGTSWAVTITAALGSYLARIGGHQNASFGVPQMNRMFGPNIPAETRTLGKLGAQTGTTAVNILPVNVSSTGQVPQVLEEVKGQYARNTTHPLARHEDLERLAQREDSRFFGAQINVIPFDAVLSLGKASAEDAQPPVARIHNVSAGPVADMTFTLRGVPGRGQTISLECDANPDLYTLDELKFHAEHLENWLAQWAQAALDEQPLDVLMTVLPEELTLLESFNETAHPVEYKTLLERFQDAAARYPEEPALYAAAPDHDGTLNPQSPQAYEFSQVLTYRQLDTRARALAAAMLKAGVRPKTAVGLRFHRGLEQYIALYAALYAGVAYVPILPDLPADRVNSMLEDAHCSAILYGTGLNALSLKPASEEGQATEELPQLSFNELTTPIDSPINSEQSAVEGDLPGNQTGLEETAYILFTSGSTGRPKGVAISHRAIDNRLRWQQAQIPIGPADKTHPEDRIFHKTPISFDVHVWELYWPLQEGAAVVIAAPEGHRDPAYLARVITEQNVTCLHFVPTMLSAFLESPTVQRILSDADFGAEKKHQLRYLVCSGEALQKDQILSAHELLGAYPLNLYGPTEAAVDVTFWDTARDPQRRQVPIGQPVWNTGARILDHAGQPVPVGVTGELYLSGVQLATGYQNNPEATQNAFVHDAVTSERLYRTGDLAQWQILNSEQPTDEQSEQPQGVILYRGRADHQIKLRGQRLELGEIENTLSEVPGVQSAVVLLYTKLPAPALAAFLEVGALEEPEREAVVADARQYCENNLPDYMVPTLWQTLEKMPLSASGKADRKKLAQVDFTFEDPSADGPHGLLEQQISSIMANVLGRTRFGITEDFFAAGGTSLAALNVIAQIEENLGRRLSIGALFANPTVQGLVAALGEETGSEFAPVLALREVEPADSNPAPLFILPPAGGLGWCYAGYLAHLPAHQPVYALQNEAFSNPQAQTAGSLQELAENYLARIRETLTEHKLPARFTLMGWSVGGTAALEVAALAESDGFEVNRVVLLDAYPAEQWQGIPAPDEQESFRALLRMGGLPEEPSEAILDLPQTLEKLQEAGSALGYLPEDKLGVCLNTMRASAALMRGSHQHAFGGEAVLVGVPHEDQPYLKAQGWEKYAGAFRAVTLENGTHPDLVNPAYIPKIITETSPEARR